MGWGGGGDCLDSHKAFTVHYKIGEDLDLSYHYDKAEVTLNVSLGKEFSGGELFFGDMRQVYTLRIDAYRFSLQCGGVIWTPGLTSRGHGLKSLSDH